MKNRLMSKEKIKIQLINTRVNLNVNLVSTYVTKFVINSAI